MVDDSHAVGFVGPQGGGTPDLFGVQDRVDIVSGTLGKALGGASGGYIAARAEIVELLRQRSRPYLFSNAVAPAVVAGSLAALDQIAGGGEQREALQRNTSLFRSLMAEAGFDVLRRRSSDQPGDVRRRRDRRPDRRRHARAGRLRHRVLLSGGAAGQGPDPGAAVGGALRGRRARPASPRSSLPGRRSAAEPEGAARTAVRGCRRAAALRRRTAGHHRAGPTTSRYRIAATGSPIATSPPSGPGTAIPVRSEKFSCAVARPS